MDATSSDHIAFHFPSLFQIHKNGHIDRFTGEEKVPPSTDPDTGVQSKDIILDPESGLSARIFLPRIPDPTRKLPLLVYFHGGVFCIESPFSPLYHRHVGTLAAKSRAVALSVHYRRAPEHPLPAAYEDAWAAVTWAAQHCSGLGPEQWINDYADLSWTFLAGDSAGGNLAHYVARRAGVDGPVSGLGLLGVIAVHPYFETEESGPNKLLEIIFPSLDGLDDPRVKPSRDPELGRIGCGKVLVCLAEKDHLRESGRCYHEALKKSGFGGVLEIFESQGVDHCFHLFDPSSDKAVELVNRMAAFLESP